VLKFQITPSIYGTISAYKAYGYELTGRALRASLFASPYRLEELEFYEDLFRTRDHCRVLVGAGARWLLDAEAGSRDAATRGDS
jgi:hypothetical protein